MNKSIEELEQLNGYRFLLKEYKENHCTLTLLAVNPKNTSMKYKVHFANVTYIQMPLGWIGGFEIGSDGEREEVIKKTGLSIRGFSSAEKLFKANQGQTLILGALMLIEPSNTE
jgi:hypothetical protein